jgi:hypothetical protein
MRLNKFEDHIFDSGFLGRRRHFCPPHEVRGIDLKIQVPGSLAGSFVLMARAR